MEKVEVTVNLTIEDLANLFRLAEDIDTVIGIPEALVTQICMNVPRKMLLEAALLNLKEAEKGLHDLINSYCLAFLGFSPTDVSLFINEVEDLERKKV